MVFHTYELVNENPAQNILFEQFDVRHHNVAHKSMQQSKFSRKSNEFSMYGGISSLNVS